MKQQALLNLICTSGMACAAAFVNLTARAASSDWVVSHVVTKDTALGRSVDSIVGALKQAGFAAKAHHEITTWPGLQVKGELAGMQAMKKDEISLLFLTDGPCANVAPKCTVFTMPFLFKNTEEATKFADNPEVMKALDEEFSKNGMKLLAIYENGWRQTYSPETLVTSPEQVKGKKFRVMQSPAYMKFVSSMGGLPTPSAWGDVYALTKAKTVFAFEAPLAIFFGNKLYDHNKNVTLTSHVYSVFYALVSEKRWNSLSEDQKNKVKKIVWEQRLKQRKDNAADEKKILEKLKAMDGVKIHEPTPAEFGVFKDTTKVVFEEFKSKYPAEILKAIEEARK